MLMKLKIKLKPHSREQKIQREGNLLVVKVLSPAKDGKANAEAVKLLKKYFKKNVKIKSGFTSRNKWIEVEDI